MGSVRSFEGMSIMSGAVSGEDDTLLGPTEGLQARIVHPHRMPTMVALNAASILEKSDEQLLPSVYKYVGCSLKKATPGACSIAHTVLCNSLEPRKAGS